LANTAFILVCLVYHTFKEGAPKTNSRPIEMLGVTLVICGVLYYFSYPKIMLMIGLVEIPIILIAILIRKRNRDANRKVYKADYRTCETTKKQVYKADFMKSDCRKQHWTERNSLKKSMKKVAYKFPSYRH